MRTFKLLCNIWAILCLAATPAFAQYTISKIVFQGAPSIYSQAALEAASGLKQGGQLSQETMQVGAQRLSDTGAFGDLQMTLDGPVKAVTVIFKITPLDPSHQLLASFDNFVWFTPDELQDGLNSRVPLFAAQLPEAGNLQDAVQAALADMLQKKGITATVSHSIFDPTSEYPSRIVAYRVATPSVHIHTFKLTGVTPEFAAAVSNSARKLIGAQLNDGFDRNPTARALLAPYYQAGYLKARLANRTFTLTNSTADRVDVDLVATIDPGTPYHVGNVVWAGSPEMSAAAFTASCPVHTGDLATPAAVDTCANLLAAPYRKHGYADLIVSPGQSIDSDAHSVSYNFTVIPGAVYRINTLTPVGLTPAQQSDFNRGWTLKAGDVFNPDYIENFLKQNSSLRSFAGYSASYKASRDPDSHLVDVIVTFQAIPRDN